MTIIQTLKEKMCIGHISNFLGSRSGSMSFDRLLKTYGLEDIPEGNKTERLGYTLRYLYQENRKEFLNFLNMLISRHRLDRKDLEEMSSYLIPLGFQVIDRRVKEIPIEEDFFKFFEESLKHPESKRAEEGSRDGAIITLSEKIIGMMSPFVLVDYGCGEGRLITGLMLLDERVLSLLTYIGVDKNTKYLEKIEENIRILEFNKKVKNYKLMTPQEFFALEVKADFVFLINVLHEIPLIDLPHTLYQLESKLRKGGHLVVNEMRELTKGELGFVSWESKDFLEVFGGTSLQPRLHPYETRRGIPLVNVDLVKVGKEASEATLVDNCFKMLDLKLERIDRELKKIKNEGTRSTKYAYLLVLKDNIETQKKDYDIKKNPGLSSRLIKCPDCKSRNLKRRFRDVPDETGFEVTRVWDVECLRCGHRTEIIL